MVRSMASCVSALSGGVAKSHQTFCPVSSTPSKIPYGGFSPVRLQTGGEPDATFIGAVETPTYRRRLSWSGVHPLVCPVNWTCVPSERAERPLELSRPVALGSRPGYSVRPDHRLL